ncbi:hypothetical protein ACS0TY_007098 [Phlomoides rotata]
MVVTNAGMVLKEKSFKEALTSKIKGDGKEEGHDREVGKEKNEKLRVFNVKEDEKAWLEHCWVASIRKDYSWEDNGEEMQGECGIKMKLIYMGDNVILIQNLSEVSLQELSKEMEEWFNHWFDWYRAWRPEDVCHCRKVWTRWIGVPLHAWNHRFFRLACTDMGAFVKLDGSTDKKENLEIARVLISVPYLTEINEVISTQIDGRIFKIKIIEEMPWELADDPTREEYGESDNDSEWSSESCRSLFLGPATATKRGGSEVDEDSDG